LSPGLSVTDPVAAASAALGAVLAGPVSLGGSARSAVLRCQSSRGGTVVVKSYPHTGEGRLGYVTEAAGLEFTAGLRVGPELLAADPAEQVIVMSDLGDAPSLADLLLGRSQADAAAGLLDWVRACADLAVTTAGREQAFADLVARHGAGQQPSAPDSGGEGWHDGAADGISRWIGQRLRLGAIPRLLDALGLEVPAGLRRELAGIAANLLSGQWEVFSPGDICPDNNLLTGQGLRFIDFESAEFHSAFLDAAYLRMPFSSCWCVFRLPHGLASQAESLFRGRVCEVHPELSDDKIWAAGLRAAMVTWTMHSMTYLLDRSMIADAPMIGGGWITPTARQLLRYRWQQLHAALAEAGEFPAVAELMTRLLAATSRWQAPDMPPYPAFR
jgi:hypothetical protein